MGFTTLITKHLPVEANNKKTIQNFPYASNYRRNKVELKTKFIHFLFDFNFKAFYRKMRKCGHGSYKKMYLCRY